MATAGGAARTATGNFTAPGLTCHAMIARIGEGSPFEVLASVSRTSATGGRLYLGVDDDELTDDSGSWQARVKVCLGGTLEQCVTR